MDQAPGCLTSLQPQSQKRLFQRSVSYLGHIDAEGIHLMKEKTDAIENAPVPTNVTELRSFLSLLNYYGKFIPNLTYNP